MVDYLGLKEMTDTLIKESGRSVTFIRQDESAVSSTKPWNGFSSGSEITFSTYGVFTTPSAAKQFGLMALGAGTEYDDVVSFSEQVIMVSPGETDLREYPNVLDQEVRWKVIGLQVLKPSTTTLLAFVGVRR